MVESIIDSLKEYKSLCEFNASDFNADKVKLYEKVRQMMARKYASENYFEPVEKTVAEKPVKEMSREEYQAYKVARDKEAEMIRKGYNRMKEKVKNIRQDYSKAVVSGTWSGSGKIVIEHYDDLATIWGGSPSTKPLAFGVDSTGTLSSQVSESDENEETVMPFSCSPSSTPSLPGHEAISAFQTIKRPRSTTPSEWSLSPSDSSREWSIPPNFDPEEGDSESVDVGEPHDEEICKGKTPIKRKKAEAVSNVPKLIDNKCKHLEKRLTAAQRDQKLLEAAKEDACLRKEMMDCFRESTSTTAKAIEQMSQTMKGLSEGIVHGMALLANALATPQQPSFQQPVQQHCYQQPGLSPFQSEGFYQPMQAPVGDILTSQNSQRAPVDKENTYFQL